MCHPEVTRALSLQRLHMDSPPQLLIFGNWSGLTFAEKLRVLSGGKKKKKLCSGDLHRPLGSSVPDWGCVCVWGSVRVSAGHVLHLLAKGPSEHDRYIGGTVNGFRLKRQPELGAVMLYQHSLVGQQPQGGHPQ